MSGISNGKASSIFMQGYISAIMQAIFDSPILRVKANNFSGEASLVSNWSNRTPLGVSSPGTLYARLPAPGERLGQQMANPGSHSVR